MLFFSVVSRSYVKHDYLVHIFFIVFKSVHLIVADQLLSLCCSLFRMLSINVDVYYMFCLSGAKCVVFLSIYNIITTIFLLIN